MIFQRMKKMNQIYFLLHKNKKNVLKPLRYAYVYIYIFTFGHIHPNYWILINYFVVLSSK